MNYEGISFNSEWVASKKVGEFIKHESHHGLSADQLKDIHALCKAKHSKSVLPGGRPSEEES